MMVLAEWLRQQHLSWSSCWTEITRKSGQSGSFLRTLPVPNQVKAGMLAIVRETNLLVVAEQLAQSAIRVVSYLDHEYPPLLREIADPPLALYVRGSLTAFISEDLQREQSKKSDAIAARPPPIAVVGTRTITSYGKTATEILAGGLARAGCPIISGFMFGVDVHAHQAAVAAGGYTVGVLGYGLGQRWYPQSNAPIAEKILEAGGALLTEYPPNTPPTKAYFPARNRIVAGMCAAVLVVEAGKQSGSHITAQCAVDEGRLVAAVPGPITSPYSEGTKQLIQQGALMATCAADVLTELGGCYTSMPPTDHSRNVRIEHQRLYTSLVENPLDLGELQQKNQSMSMAHIVQALAEMEIEGHISREGSYYRAVCVS
jgi:DNA processing protein